MTNSDTPPARIGPGVGQPAPALNGSGASASGESTEKVMGVLYPCGTTVEVGLRDGSLVHAKVYPMGFRHIGDFMRDIEDALPKVSAKLDLKRLGGDDANDRAKAMVDLLTVAIPLCCTDLLHVVNECVDGVDLNDDRIPHWCMPKIIEAWIDESFGSPEKVRPWMEAVDRILARTSDGSEDDGETSPTESSSSADTDTTSSKS